MSSKSEKKRNRRTAILATIGIMSVAVAAVFAVRAYLNAQSEEKKNEFAPMTYTDTNVEEPVTSGTIPSDNTDVNYTWTNKSATVKNSAGTDKKPVFVRVAVKYMVYDSAGVNVSTKYSDIGLEFTSPADWTEIDGYYYYNKILDPGESTSDVFNGGGVTITNADKLPEGYEVKIDVIADTVQAVSVDTSLWTADDYTASEVTKAWGKTPNITKATKLLTW